MYQHKNVSWLCLPMVWKRGSNGFLRYHITANYHKVDVSKMYILEYHPATPTSLQKFTQRFKLFDSEMSSSLWNVSYVTVSYVTISVKSAKISLLLWHEAIKLCSNKNPNVELVNAINYITYLDYFSQVYTFYFSIWDDTNFVENQSKWILWCTYTTIYT